MYTVIGGVTSRTFRVLWMLEELGQDYTHVPAKPWSDEVKAHSPLGKVPVFLDGDAALTDSVAIMTYLADKHGKLTAPAGTLARGRQDAMTQRIVDEFDACIWTAARHSFVLPEDKRVPEVKDSLRWEFARSETKLAQAMGDGPFVMGEQITVPDILLGHCLGWAILAKFGISEPVLSAYLDRLRTRPAYVAARQDPS